MSETLRLQLFGHAQVDLNGRAVTDFISTKSQALLFYLALTPGVHTRVQMAALLWPDMQTQPAAANLRNVLSNLRKLVGDHLLIEGQTVAFDFDSSHDIDVVQFLLLSNSAEITSLQTAADLYKRDFLDDFQVRSADNFDHWEQQTRTQLHIKLLATLLTLAQHYAVTADSYPQAVATARQLLTLEPWHEEACRLLMTVQAGQGHRTAAIRTYKQCRQYLWDELSIDPSAETVALYSRLFASTVVIENNLPVTLTPFIGRKQALATIHKRLHQDECHLLTIVGIGGAGKTRLALEAATRAAQPQLDASRFDGGIFFIPLATLDPAVYESHIEIGLLTLIATAINFTITSKKPLRQQLFKYLATKRMLLLFDCFEHVLDVASVLDQLMRAAPRVKIVATSREALNLRGEWLLPLAGLSYPQPGESERTDQLTVTGYDALVMIEQAAERLNAKPATAADRLAFSRICRAVEGLPLGIELASGWLRMMSATSVADLVEESFDTFVNRQPSTPQRHNSLRALFDSAWQLLAPNEQRVLMQLSVLKGVFTLEFAAAITTNASLAITSLHDKSLLHKIGEGRYGLFGYVRQYASEKLKSDPQLYRETKDRSLTYFAGLLDQQRELFFGPNPERPLKFINDNHENFSGAWKWAIKQENAPVIEKIEYPLLRFWQRTNRHELALNFIQQALETFDQERFPRIHGMLRLDQGVILRDSDNLQDGIDTVLLAISLLQQHDKPMALMAAHVYAGLYLTDAGDFAAAQEQLDAAMALGEEVNSYHLWTLAYRNRAILHGYMGLEAVAQGELKRARLLFEQARSLLLKALKIARESNNIENQMIVLASLAHAYIGLDKFELAEDYLREALIIGRKIDDNHFWWDSAFKLAILEARRGDFISATRRWTNVVTNTRTRRHTDAVVLALLSAAMILVHTQSVTSAVTIYTFLLNYPLSKAATHAVTRTELYALSQQLDPEQFKQAQDHTQRYNFDSILEFAEATILDNSTVNLSSHNQL